MIKAKWKNGYGFYKADAQKVAEEIMEVCDSADLNDAKPEDVLVKARDENSELHKCFEWDDAVAAEKYRLRQVGYIIRLLVIKEECDESTEYKERPEVRVFYKTKEDEGYKPTHLIVQKKDEYDALLQRAWSELRAFKQKYSMLKELDEIFKLID